MRLVPLTLVESSLVRCTSFILSFFLSGFVLWSSTSSGSIWRGAPFKCTATQDNSLINYPPQLPTLSNSDLTKWKYFPEKFSSSEGKHTDMFIKILFTVFVALYKTYFSAKCNASHMHFSWDTAASQSPLFCVFLEEI